MNTSNQTYKELAIPYFKEVFDLIDEIMLKHKIPYYLIGVSAIALELLKDNVKPIRGTKDIDFAIMISSINQYEQISKALHQVGFNKVEAPWTFYSQSFDIVLDLLPFGEIEEKYTFQFTERKADLHVLGFKEVLENTNSVAIEDKIVNIPPLPGMVILKLVAWSDRSEERENDLADILKIIEHYFDYNFDEIVEFHNDIFPEDNFDKRIISAEVLGRKAKIYLDKSEVLAKRIFKVLEENLNEKHQSKIAKEWAIRKQWKINYALKLLHAFQKGLHFK